MATSALERYLARYAEPEATHALALSIDSHDRCLVIPAFQESLTDIDAVTAAIKQKFLLILVVNSHEEDPTTSDLLTQISSRGESRCRSGNLDYRVHRGQHLIVVDRCSPGCFVPLRQGVGLARKIGADIACALMTIRQVTSRLIHMTDADVHLPRDYFHPAADSKSAALIYPFVHKQDDDSTSDAALLYEIAMLYYVAGLRYAGSPYAWPTVGSTLAVDAVHYAMVRGFPKRNAAEDFYLLNKLAKTGDIRQLPGPAISISARSSTRVPFGTGPAVRQISAMDDPLTGYHFYHPTIFLHLKAVLEALNDAWDEFDPGHLPDPAAEAVDEMGLADFLAGARSRTRKREVFDKAVHDWFDAFRTLKFVHFLRDNDLPSVPIGSLTGSTILPAAEAGDGSLKAIRRALAARCFDPTC